MKKGFRPRVGNPAPAYYLPNGTYPAVIGHGFHWGDRHRWWKKRKPVYRKTFHRLLEAKTKARSHEHLRQRLLAKRPSG